MDTGDVIISRLRLMDHKSLIGWCLVLTLLLKKVDIAKKRLVSKISFI